jgi:hypothetical protein
VIMRTIATRAVNRKLKSRDRIERRRRSEQQKQASKSPGIFRKLQQSKSGADSHLVNARSTAVEAHQVAFAGIPPIMAPNQTGQAIDQPHDGLPMIRGDCPSCYVTECASDTYSTLASNKDA